MKKFYLAFTFVLLSHVLFAQNSFEVISPSGTLMGMSRDGKNITFYEGPVSFLWQRGNADPTVITPQIETRARAVSNNGVIAGEFADEDHIVMTYEEGGDLVPLPTAGLLQGDEWVNLGLNPNIPVYNLESSNLAEAISSDGTIIGGAYRHDDNKTLIPAIWRNRMLEQFEVEKKGQGGRIMSINEDASVACGWIAPEGEWKPAVWLDGKLKNIVYTNGMSLPGEAISVSSDGKYVALQINNYAALYNTQEDKLTIIGRHDGYWIGTASGVSDNGIVVGYSQLIGMQRRPFIYTDRLGFMDLAAYAVKANIAMPDIDLGAALHISSDGSRIAGFGYAGIWAMNIEEHFTGFNRPRNLKVEASETVIGDVVVSWNAPESDPDNVLIGYNVYRNGELVNTEPINETSFNDKEVWPAKHTYKVTSVWEAGESNPTLNAEVTVSKLESFPFTETFDSFYSFEEEGWVADNLDLWYVDDASGLPAPGAQFNTPLGTTYSQSLTSPYVDAREVSKLYLSYNIASGAPRKFDNHKFSSQIYDGQDWITLKEYVLDQFTSFKYEEFDISSNVAGKITRIRFLAEGSNAEEFMTWVVDNIRIFGEEDRVEITAPLALNAARIIDQNVVYISWLDPNGVGSLGYIESLDSDTSFGDAGTSFMVVNKFMPEDIKRLDKCLLTSIKAFLNTDAYNDESGEFEKLPQYKIVIYQDNKRVYEQAVEEPQYFLWNEIPLTTPYIIDATKSLCYGLEVTEYDPRDIPVALTTDKAINGRSNLFSNDGGQTWVSISTLSEETRFHNSLALTAVIMESQTALPKERISEYRLYRGNEYLPVARDKNYFIDTTPLLDETCYKVIAFYDTDESSEFSNEVCVEDITGIENETANDRLTINYDASEKTISVEGGEFKNLMIYDLNGRNIMETSENTINIKALPAGIYILKVNMFNGMVTKKIAKP